MFDTHNLLTRHNFTPGDISRLKDGYIVIHYVGATGGAKSNCEYYASGHVGSSAHLYVDFDGSIWRSVEEHNVAWHCGAKTYTHPVCRNANSIGIELCVRNKGSKADTSKDWYFEDKTVESAIELVKHLMDKYDIPAEHVIRHHDITGKICPNPFVYNHTKHTWDEFKKAIAAPTECAEGFLPAADGMRWWYRHKDGSCAKGGWYWLTEATEQTSGWYLFDKDGYMLTGCQKDPSGESFFLCQDKGIHEGKCMVTDSRGALKIADSSSRTSNI